MPWLEFAVSTKVCSNDFFAVMFTARERSLVNEICDVLKSSADAIDINQ